MSNLRYKILLQLVNVILMALQACNARIYLAHALARKVTLALHVTFATMDFILKLIVLVQFATATRLAQSPHSVTIWDNVPANKAIWVPNVT